MYVLSLLYQLLIGPLELFFDVLYCIAYRFIGDAGLSIIFLSLAMNFLVLPLYRRADAMQEAERDRAAQMKPWLDHIRKTFTGDERFMMQQTYYRQCGYKQTDALRGSISLLLEIPFFIAAYHFLSNLELLRGVPFGPIVDLGAPDGLLVIGGFVINVLPLLMTAINIVSAAIYMKGFPLRSKIQMYGIAAIFLVLLYASPAGLVFYWTLNNLFSLVKNIFYKLKNPARVLTVMASVTGIALVVFALVAHPFDTMLKHAFVIGCGLLLQVPLAVRALGRKLPRPRIPEATPADDRTFLLGCVFLALLCGLLIPCTVIASSPTEFVDAASYRSPLWYVASSLALSLGTFVIWFGVFYRLATPRAKTVLNVAIWVVAGAGVVNYLLFGTDYGTMSPLLKFDSALSISGADMAVNAVAVLVVAVALVVVWRFKPQVVKVVYGSLCIALLAMSAVNIVGINDGLAPVRDAAAAAEAEGSESAGLPTFTLSKDGRNVVVIMMDRAMSYYLPYLMNEKPELKEKLAGFTYYPNCVSYGAFTNAGAPGLYGGYEYTPERINERADESLREKQNEALRVMPLLFDDAGFETTVFDPTYAGYSVYPDLSIFNDRPSIRKYITMDGRFVDESLGIQRDSAGKSDLLSRDFFCYSLFKVAPVALQPTIYDLGNYNSTAAISAWRALEGTAGDQVKDGVSIGHGIDEPFAKSYAVLDKLPDITRISEDAEGGFLMMSNDTAHEPIALVEPEYELAAQVDNTEYDQAHLKRYAADGSFVDFSDDVPDKDSSKTQHYEVNMAALLKLGEWFDYLRENDVFDNTRIIIVSDHARNLQLNDGMVMVPDGAQATQAGSDPAEWDMMMFNCMLLVKDFDSREFTTDTSFMTNADTPALALADVVEDPHNPATGRAIDMSGKKDGARGVFWPDVFAITVNDGNTFMPGRWFNVHDDIFTPENWEYLGER